MVSVRVTEKLDFALECQSTCGYFRCWQEYSLLILLLSARFSRKLHYVGFFYDVSWMHLKAYLYFEKNTMICKRN